MKKIASISLLIIILFNVVGYFVVFKVEQFQIKSAIKLQIKEGLANEHLIKITLKKSELALMDWEEVGKEFRFKDNMYDVVKYIETKKSITFYCINDSKEESLFSNLDDHILTHVANNSSQTSSKKINKHFVKLYFLEVQSCVIPSSKLVYVSFPLKVITDSSVLEKTTPPPELV